MGTEGEVAGLRLTIRTALWSRKCPSPSLGTMKFLVKVDYVAPVSGLGGEDGPHSVSMGAR